MKRIIVPAGYMGSGSSAITDLVSEFKDCKNDYKKYEYILLHCPNGLFDLEDKLLKGNNALRSDEALRSFEEQMKKLYDKKFWWVGNYQKIIGPNFKNIYENYVKNIEQYSFPGYWYYHEEVNTKMFIKLLLRKPFKILFSRFINFSKVLRYNDGMRISYIKSKDFYKHSHDFIYEVLDEISKGAENVILDQFLLPFNLYRIDNYFDDKLKVIVVERDPRDVYIINKYIWGATQKSVPFPLEALEFSKYYRNMRESEIINDSKKILRIKFEDLIYNYDDTLKEIMRFLNFKEKDHVRKFERFDPKISIRNTQTFRDKKYIEEIKIIEKELHDYLYDFPYLINNDVLKTVEFD